MRVKVINDFIDKHTGKYNPVGAEVDVTNERFAELEKAGKFVVKVAEEAAEPVQNDVEQVEPTENEPETTAATEAPIEVAEEAAEPPKKSGRRTTKK